MSPHRPPLFTFRFTSLCLLMLLAYCNISIFYSLYPYLEDLGIAQQWRGLIISSSALATILCFLFVTPRLSERTAPRAVFAGIGLLIACGLAYLFVRHTLGLLVLRLFNGMGIALLTASAMTLLVGEIPPERSGQAFGFYSVAMLLPYSIVPALFDHVGGLLPGPEYGYALMSLALVPAALVNLALLRHGRGRVAAKTPQAVADGGQGVGFAAMLASARRPATGLLLLLNSVYYLNFSALFFLSKSLFASRDLGGVGLFFSIQTGLMLATRLAATPPVRRGEQAAAHPVVLRAYRPGLRHALDHPQPGHGGGHGAGARPGHGRGAALAQRADVRALRAAPEGGELQPHGHGPAGGQLPGADPGRRGGGDIGLFGLSGRGVGRESRGHLAEPAVSKARLDRGDLVAGSTCCATGCR
jgi:MFS family permease